jgi:thiol-disulfide isomerase/thioredoxin
MLLVTGCQIIALWIGVQAGLAFQVARVAASPLWNVNLYLNALEQLDSLALRARFTHEGDYGLGFRRCELDFDVVMAKGGRLRVRVLRGEQELGGLIARGGESGEIIEWDHASRRYTSYRSGEIPSQPLLLWPICEDARGLSLYASRHWQAWLDRPSAYLRFPLESALREAQSFWTFEHIGSQACAVLTVRYPEVTLADGLTAREVIRLAFDLSTRLPVLDESLSYLHIPSEAAGQEGAQSQDSDRSSRPSRQAYAYQDVRINPPLDERTFRFDPPPGFTRVEPLAMLPKPPLVDQSITGWKLQSFDDREIELESHLYDGCLLLVTWATWCAPCKAELRRLAELAESDQHRGRFRVIAVNVEQNRKRAADFLKRSPLPFPVAYDPDFQSRLGTTALPTTLVVDARGVIRAMLSGWDGSDDVRSQEKLLLHAIAGCSK